MKQVLQNYKTGDVTLIDAPVPRCPTQGVLVKNEYSLISTGTERSTIALGKKSLLGKARSRPDLVKKVIDKAKKEGIFKTFQEAMGRLDVPTPLGYSSAGVVVATGKDVTAYTPGDRVACIGQSFASHADYVAMPLSLVAKLPSQVSTQEGAFGMLGAIAMNGVRCADLTFGSTVVVMGLGLLGLLTVQILKAYGCQVIAYDPIPSKVDLAKTFGVQATSDLHELLTEVKALTQGEGVDAVILTVATQSKDPVDLAIELVRFRGKCVLVGVADVHPERNALWNKEVSLIVSKAAGLEGLDHPISHVRWTENKNLAEFLRLISVGLVKVSPLISGTYAISEALSVYDSIMKGLGRDFISAVFSYETTATAMQRQIPLKPIIQQKKDKISVGVMGAGLFVRSLLLPAIKKVNAIHLNTLVTASGASAWHSGKKYQFDSCATDPAVLFENKAIDAIIAATPHHTHADFVKKALDHNKHLFIEKPLCTQPSELTALTAAFKEKSPLPVIQVGHNRRFSPHAQKIKQWLTSRVTPLTMTMRVNAGFVPKSHWVHSSQEGRSRMVGEMTHFIDLFQYWIGAEPVEVFARAVKADDAAVVNRDNVLVSLAYSDGSIASLVYTAMGDKSFSRERAEIFYDGNTIVLDDFRKSEWISGGKKTKYKTASQQMGYVQELEHFLACVSGKQTVDLSDLLGPMRVAFAMEESLAHNKPISLISSVEEVACQSVY